MNLIVFEMCCLFTKYKAVYIYFILKICYWNFSKEIQLKPFYD